MDSCVELVLPYPPSGNHRNGVKTVRSKKTGKYIPIFYRKSETQKYMDAVILRCKLQKSRKLVSPKVRVDIEAYPPSNKRGRVADVDNIQKVLLDSLQAAGVFENDFQARTVFIDFKEKVFNGELRVKITEVF